MLTNFKTMELKEIKEVKKPFYLFFDTETTGLPNDWKAPPDQFPRLVQLAWLVYNGDMELIETGDYVIKPDGFEIPNEVTDVHGITTEEALKIGEDLEPLLRYFVILMEAADYVIGHNVSFDRKIIRGELMRKSIEYDSSKSKKICTMQSSRKYCELNKLPKLQELHNKLFEEDFTGAHNAATDIEATAKCFWRLKELGILNDKL